MKYIIKVVNKENATVALRAAQSLERDGYDDCIYVYGDKPNEITVWAKQNKTSITAVESGWYERD